MKTELYGKMTKTVEPEKMRRFWVEVEGGELQVHLASADGRALDGCRLLTITAGGKVRLERYVDKEAAEAAGIPLATGNKMGLAM